MGFITLPGGLSFSMAVISLWFRVPAATVVAGIAAFDDLQMGVIPLLTFGARGQTYSAGSESGPMMPSVIGLSCAEAWAAEEITNPTLYARFQYSSGGNPGEGDQYPDYFQVGDYYVPFAGPFAQKAFIEVTPDAWHHLVVSFDFSGGCSATYAEDGTITSATTCPFYWALDGVNYNGGYLFPNCVAAHSGSGDDNGIFSNWSGLGSFAAGLLDADAFAIPGAFSDADYIYNVIMAEIQIYTGVMMDTASNLDKFIVDGKPVSQTLAADFLGKDPEVYFRTQNDWITGNNRGTAGDFTPTGTVQNFSPGPSD